MHFHVSLVLLLTASSLTPAQAEPDRPANRVRPAISATRIERDFTPDGIVLGDRVWLTAQVATGFTQTTPFDGQAATERTEVRILFSDTTLYLGVVCYDSDPDAIIVSDTRRDASLRNSDSFQFILDTFGDKQNGFVFGTNAAGIEYDGQVQDEGRGGGGGGGRQQRGSGGGFNRNWDAAWTVAAHVADFGWSAEFAIPFKSLRYAADSQRPWGINFRRDIRRKIETVFWAPLGRQFNLYRVSDAGTLTNLTTPRQRLLQMTPYGLVEARRDPFGREDDDADAGFDVKYGVTPSLALDATYNTDFAQVEVDDQQVNLDRFSLFFPEKRPFFLENAGLFSVGVSGQTELFFSRRIGLEENQVIPILGGVRLSGKVGRYRVGVLTMQTEESDGRTPDNFTVGRLRRELANRSHFGILIVNREGTGSLAPDDDHNRTFAVDGQKGFGDHTELSGFLAKTSTPGVGEGDHAFRLRLSSNSETARWSLSYQEVGQGFNPEVGFLARRGFRNPSVSYFRTLRPKKFWGLQEVRPHFTYRGYWDFDGFQETGYLHLDNHLEWRNGMELHTGVNFTQEGLKEAFEITDGVTVPTGDYNNVEAQLVFRTESSKPLSISLRSFVGGFFDGDRVTFAPTLSYRVGDRFTSQVSWSYNDIDLGGGEFETNLGRLRLSYSFNNQLFVQALVQYNDTTDHISTNLRFSFLQTANTGLFVVYNEIREFGALGLEDPDRSLIVKYSRLIDILR